MARISDGDLSMDIGYRTFKDGWVVYDILWLWRVEPIINDAVLKRHNDYWGSRAHGGRHVNEHKGDIIIHLIRDVLASGKADYVTTTDPDMTLALYPVGDRRTMTEEPTGFPFLPSNHWPIFIADHIVHEREERAARKPQVGGLPDGQFELMMFIDAYNFKGCGMYYASGLTLRMQTFRADLERFGNDLRSEYLEFKGHYGVDEWNK